MRYQQTRSYEANANRDRKLGLLPIAAEDRSQLHIVALIVPLLVVIGALVGLGL